MNVQKEPLELVKTAANAIYNYDTAKLFTVIDTGFCFKMYSKEGFLGKVSYIFRRSKTSIWNIDSVTVIKNDPYSKKYSLLYKDTSENSLDSRFLVSFIVPDKAINSKILYFDMEKSITVKPTIPVTTLPTGDSSEVP